MKIKTKKKTKEDPATLNIGLLDEGGAGRSSKLGIEPAISRLRKKCTSALPLQLKANGTFNLYPWGVFYTLYTIYPGGC